MLNNKKEEVDQSAWNLSQHIINQIGSLLVSASTKFRRGDIQNSYWDTEEIRILIHDDLSQEELEKLEDYEKKICGYYSTAKKEKTVNKEEMNEIEKQRIVSAKHNHYVEVKTYRMYIMELLGKYGYSVSKKENAAKMF